MVGYGQVRAAPRCIAQVHLTLVSVCATTITCIRLWAEGILLREEDPSNMSSCVSRASTFSCAWRWGVSYHKALPFQMTIGNIISGCWLACHVCKTLSEAGYSPALSHESVLTLSSINAVCLQVGIQHLQSGIIIGSGSTHPSAPHPPSRIHTLASRSLPSPSLFWCFGRRLHFSRHSRVTSSKVASQLALHRHCSELELLMERV